MKIKLALTKVALVCLIIAGTFNSSAAFAHGGHDHGHWISPTIHGLTVVSVIMVLTIALAFLLGKGIFMLAQRKEGGRRK